MIKSLRKFFNKEEFNPHKVGQNLGVLLVHSSIHEPVNFQPFIERTLNEKEKIDFFVELIIVFIAIADRFAHDNFNEQDRSIIMNEAINKIVYGFKAQEHFGDTEEERASYFETTLSERMKMFESCSSIMGDDKNTLTNKASLHLVNKFSNQPNSNIVLETSKLLTLIVVKLISEPEFKAISEKHK